MTNDDHLLNPYTLLRSLRRLVLVEMDRDTMAEVVKAIHKNRLPARNPLNEHLIGYITLCRAAWYLERANELEFLVTRVVRRLENAADPDSSLTAHPAAASSGSPGRR
jgi:hypothetical protein